MLGSQAQNTRALTKNGSDDPNKFHTSSFYQPMTSTLILILTLSKTHLDSKRNAIKSQKFQHTREKTRF